MLRFCIVAGICAALALAACAPLPHHHRGAYHEAPGRGYGYPPPHFDSGHHYGHWKRWH